MSKRGTNWTSHFEHLSPKDEVGGYHIYSTHKLITGSGKAVFLFIVHNNEGKNWYKGKGFKALYHLEPYTGPLKEIKIAEKQSLRLSTSLALSKIKKL